MLRMDYKKFFALPANSTKAAKIGVCALLLAGVGFAAENARQHKPNPVTRGAVRHDLSRPLREMFMWAGCGGAGGEPEKRPSQSRPGTPTGTSNVTVHTNAGGLQHSTTLSVTVQ